MSGQVAAAIGAVSLLELENAAAAAAARYGVDTRLVFAIIRQESSWNVRARGRAGEIGLMQLHPKGAIAEWEAAGGQCFADYYLPANNLAVGCWYLGVRLPQLLRHFGLAVTARNLVWAYNAGVGNVRAGILPDTTAGYLKNIAAAGVDLGSSVGGSSLAGLARLVVPLGALWAVWQIVQQVRAG